MRVIELSNHPGDMLNDASRQRLAAEKRALDGYEDALIQYRARVQTLRVKRDRARVRHRWWTWLRLVFAVSREKRKIPRQALQTTGSTNLEEKLRAGIGDSADHLSDRQQAEIQRLIQQDHDFHHKRRRTGPSR